MTDLVEWLTAQIDRDQEVFEMADEGMASWPTEYLRRTIAAHRAILDRYKTAIVSHEVATGTVLGGATRMSLRIHAEHVRLLAAIYESRPGYLEEWKL